MLGHLIKKEMLDHVLSLRFTVLAVLGVVFISWALYDGLEYHLDRATEYASSQEATEDRIQQILTADTRILPGGNNWREVFDIGFLVSSPPNTLAIFERGIDPYQGRSMTISSVADWWLKRSPAAEDPFLDTFPPLDVGTVVRIIFGLFALLLSYNAFCGEKEDGTLRLSMSFALPRYRLLLAKIIGTTFPLLAALIVPVLMGCAIMSLHPEFYLNGIQWVRLGLLFAAYSLFIAVCVCAGLLLSCLTRSPSTSLVLLLVLWISWGVIIPKAGPVLADKLSPSPSVTALESSIREAAEDYWAAKQEKLDQWKSEYIEEHGISPWNVPDGRTAYYTQLRADRKRSRDFIAETERHLRRQFRNRQDAWMRTSSWISRLSPAFALGNAAASLTGAGMTRFRRAQDSLIRYLRQEQEWNSETWFDYTFDGIGSDPPDWNVDTLPRYRHQEQWPASDLVESTADIAILSFWGIFLFAAAATATLRYDCR